MATRHAHFSPEVKRDEVKLLERPGRIPSGTLTAPAAGPGCYPKKLPRQTWGLSGL